MFGQQYSKKTNPITPNQEGQQLSTIKSLNPSVTRFTLKARVTQKGNLRSWQNERGSGEMLKCTISDSTGDIEIAFFKEAARKFNDLLEQGKVYYFSNGRVKTPNKNFCRTDLEISFDSNANITPTHDDGQIAKASYKFVNINDIQDLPVGETIDVVGVLCDVGEPTQIRSKSGKDLVKRILYLMDDSGPSGSKIELTVWGDMTSSPFSNGEVLAVKAAKISDWNGRSLGSVMSSSFDLAPDIDRAHVLRQWYSENMTSLGNVVSLSEGRGSSQVRDTMVPVADRALIVQLQTLAHNSVNQDGQVATLKAWPIRARMAPEKISYPACSNPKPSSTGRNSMCNRKCEQYDSTWTCRQCGPTTPLYRYMLSVAFGDESGDTWVTLFDEEARKFLGVDATTLLSYCGDVDTVAKTDSTGVDLPEMYTMVFEQAMYKSYLLTVRAKMTTGMNNEPRLQTTVNKMQCVDDIMEKEMNALIANIDRFQF